MKGKNRGSRDKATREAMSVSAQMRWSDPLQQQKQSLILRNKPKSCSFCGLVGGHNRRTCPAVPVIERAQIEKMQRLQAALQTVLEQLSDNQQIQLCSYCGLMGHALEQCPDLVQTSAGGCPICLQQDHTGQNCKAIKLLTDMPDNIVKTVNGNAQLQLVLQKLQGDSQQGCVQVVGEYISESVGQQASLKQRTWQYLFDSQWRDPFHLGTIPVDITCPPAVEEEKVIQLAAASIYRAYLQGINRQKVDLPLSSTQSWPGGVQQQYVEIKPVVEGVIRGLKSCEEFSGRIGVEIWDKGDAVGAWEGEKLLAVLFPTANQLPRIKEKLNDQSRLSIIFNPQWQLGGQIVSDFGFGENKRKAEELVESFEQTFYHELIGIQGDQLLLIRAFPLLWHVYLLNPEPQLVLKTEQKPTQKQLEQMLRDMDSTASVNSLAGRLQRLGSWAAEGEMFQSDEIAQSDDQIEEQNFSGLDNLTEDLDLEHEILLEEDEAFLEQRMSKLDIVTGEDIKEIN